MMCLFHSARFVVISLVVTFLSSASISLAKSNSVVACKTLKFDELTALAQQNAITELVFFASWCAGCQPHIVDSDPKSTVYVVSWDENHAAQQVLQTLQPEARWCVDDPKGHIRQRFQVEALPAHRSWPEKE
jgi:hypothetical protein